MLRARVLLLVSSLGLAACASNPPVPATTAPRAPTGNTWVDRSAEYPALVLQVFRQATTYVESQVGTRQPGTWAVVLDADETTISNLGYQLERERQGLTYSTDSWHGWVVRRQATPMPGAAAFLSRVKALGGLVAIVTNRLASECEDTRAVFRAHALPFDGMLCRPEGQPSDKNPRFKEVASGTWAAGRPVEIVAFVGDNILDFPEMSQAAKAGSPGSFSAFGGRFFILPNPMYGSWQ